MDLSGILKQSFPQTHEQIIYAYLCYWDIGVDNIILAVAGEVNLDFISLVHQSEIKDSSDWPLKSNLLGQKQYK